MLWFVDNKATVGAILKGTAKPEDIDDMIGAIHAFAANLNCRIWFEWVDSASNSSDGLSRDGLLCPFCAENRWKTSDGTLPPSIPPGQLTAWALGTVVGTVR